MPHYIVRNDLGVLGPTGSTAVVTRNPGYVVSDALLALDATFQPHPQRGGDAVISPDKVLYRFAR